MSSLSHRDVETAIAALARGEMIVLADNESRENESDLICAADAITAQQMALIVRYTTGIVCVSISKQRACDLEIELLAPDPLRPTQQPRSNTAFAMPVDVIADLTTGVSASERASTSNRLADPSAKPGDFIRPGHIFPLIAVDGGLTNRQGHTEASLDMVIRAGRSKAAVLAELVNDDGTMMRRNEAKAFAQDHGLVYTTVDALLEVYFR